MLESGHLPDTLAKIGCTDGKFHEGKLATLPLYDKAGEIQRGIHVAIPLRD